MATKQGSQEQHPLQSDRGTTTVADAVVSAIANIAAAEVDGVDLSHGGNRVPGDNSPTVGEFLDRVTGSQSRVRGLSVETGQRQAAVDMVVNVVYGRPIPDLTKAVRNNVIKRIENLTGLEVTEVNITVNDVNIPEQ